MLIMQGVINLAVIPIFRSIFLSGALYNGSWLGRFNSQVVNPAGQDTFGSDHMLLSNVQQFFVVNGVRPLNDE